jgi:membrane protein
MLKKTSQVIIHLPSLLKKALTELLKNDPLRMAGATAFFTTFALPPILVILIQALKLILNPATIRNKLFNNLSGIVGEETVTQLRNVIKALRSLAQNWWIIIGGFIFLLFVATTLFKIIKSSINQVWKIKAIQKQGLAKNLGSRARSVAVILGAGLLFIVGLLAEAMQAFIGKYIFEISPLLSFYYNSVLNYVFSISIVTLWFSILFRYLPDGRPKWKIAFAGAFLTAILFTIGKIILHWLLSYSNINTVYGTSAAIVLLLLFVFYSALILYYGAAFTKVWGLYKNEPITPLSHAMHYRLIEETHDGPITQSGK